MQSIVSFIRLWLLQCLGDIVLKSKEAHFQMFKIHSGATRGKCNYIVGNHTKGRCIDEDN